MKPCVDGKKKLKKRNVLKWMFIAGGIGLSIVIILDILDSTASPNKGAVALIRIRGEIGTGGFFSESTDPDSIASMMKKAESNPNTKAILIEINSPGGSAVASEEIMKTVKASRQPTIALIRDIGTSGAYWIASAADYVIASPISITGSIGVRSDYLEFSEFLADHGIRYEQLTSGKYKDMGSPYRNLTEDERLILQKSLVKMHKYFLESVEENRGITNPAVIDNISSASIFLGSEAKEIGLIDETGGREEAENWIRNKTGLREISYATYEKKSLFNMPSLITSTASNAGRYFASGMLSLMFQPQRNFNAN